MDVLAEDIIFENVACPVLVLDSQGTILRANAACLRATGRSREELVGHRFTEFVPLQLSWSHTRVRGENGQGDLIVATGSADAPACADNELREHEQRLGDAFADAPIGMVL